MAATEIGTLTDLKKIGDGTAGYEINADYVLVDDIVIPDDWDSLCHITLGGINNAFNGTLDGYYPGGGVSSNPAGFYKIIFENSSGDTITLKRAVSTSHNGYGLFSVANSNGGNTKFLNLTIDVNDKIVGTDNDVGIGILVGSVYGNGKLVIDNCNVIFSPSGSLSGGTNSSGLIGKTDSGNVVITNSKITDADITGGTYVGGFIGRAGTSSNIEAENCVFIGTVSGTSYYVGGFSGALEGVADINKVETHGTVTGDSYGVGGLTGSLSGGTGSMVQNSFSSANVTGANFVGGLIGHCNAKVHQSYATGDVTANIGGGFVGRIHKDVTITECFATGNVFTKAAGGGFAGMLNLGGLVSDCYSTGNVFSEEHAGGFVGSITNGVTAKFNNCYSTGIATSTSGSAGSFIGIINLLSDENRDTAADITITNCIGFGSRVYGTLAGNFVGEISTTDLLNPQILVDDSSKYGTGPLSVDVIIEPTTYYWDGISLSGSSFVMPANIDTTVSGKSVKATFSVAPSDSISKSRVWFTYAAPQDSVWSTWSTSTWEELDELTSNYGLPVLKWQVTDPKVPILDGSGLFYRSGSGSSTGGATISNNDSSPRVEPQYNQPVDTTPTQPTQQQPSQDTPTEIAPVDGGEKSTSYTTWLIVGIVLAIVAVATVFGYRYYNGKKMQH